MKLPLEFGFFIVFSVLRTWTKESKVTTLITSIRYEQGEGSYWPYHEGMMNWLVNYLSVNNNKIEPWTWKQITSNTYMHIGEMRHDEADGLPNFFKEKLCWCWLSKFWTTLSIELHAYGLLHTTWGGSCIHWWWAMTF